MNIAFLFMRYTVYLYDVCGLLCLKLRFVVIITFTVIVCLLDGEILFSWTEASVGSQSVVNITVVIDIMCGRGLLAGDNNGIDMMWRVARTGPLPLALQSASVSESLMMTSSYGTGYVVNTDDIMGGGMWRASEDQPVWP